MGGAVYPHMFIADLNALGRFGAARDELLVTRFDEVDETPGSNRPAPPWPEVGDAIKLVTEEGIMDSVVTRVEPECRAYVRPDFATVQLLQPTERRSRRVGCAHMQLSSSHPLTNVTTGCGCELVPLGATSVA